MFFIFYVYKNSSGYDVERDSLNLCEFVYCGEDYDDADEKQLYAIVKPGFETADNLLGTLDRNGVPLAAFEALTNGLLNTISE